MDTHVRRVAERLGWTTGRECASAEATRRRLETFLPAETWGGDDAARGRIRTRGVRCREGPSAKNVRSRRTGVCPSADVKDVEDA